MTTSPQLNWINEKAKSFDNKGRVIKEFRGRLPKWAYEKACQQALAQAPKNSMLSDGLHFQYDGNVWTFDIPTHGGYGSTEVHATIEPYYNWLAHQSERTQKSILEKYGC